MLTIDSIAGSYEFSDIHGVFKAFKGAVYVKLITGNTAELLDMDAISVRLRFNNITHSNHDSIVLIDLDEFRNYWAMTDAKNEPTIKPQSLCDCGGYKTGFKDYTRQHSQWCKVYRYTGYIDKTIPKKQ